jgi:hypothetical protein
MSFHRKAFLVWWSALVLFIAAFTYVNWDLVSIIAIYIDTSNDE